MKKKLFKVSLISTILLIVFIAVFVITNLFDGPEPEGIYRLTDLYPASLDGNNAFYQVMAFSYPAQMDITSDNVIGNIRKMSEPDVLNLPAEKMGKLFRIQRDLSKKLSLKGRNVKLKFEDKDFEGITKEKESIFSLIKSNRILMARYFSLLQTDKIEDFSLTVVTYPLPDYMSILKIAKLYTAKNILSSIEGNWKEGVTGIIKQIDFFRKFSRNSRLMITKLINFQILKISAKSLAFIMNQENCPDEIFSIILDSLPPLEESEISLQKPLIFEFLVSLDIIDEMLKNKKGPFEDIAVISGFFPSTSKWLNFLIKFKIFLNRNRTIQLNLDDTEHVFDFETKPPFQWKQDFVKLAPPNHSSGLFWWFSNPVGKALTGLSYNNYQKSIYNKYKTKAIFDLTRICAEYHKKFTLDKSIDIILKELDTFKAIDPFSGKSYAYNKEKLVLYSVATNRVDDGGIDKINKNDRDVDLILACIFIRKAGSNHSENTK